MAKQETGLMKPTSVSTGIKIVNEKIAKLKYIQDSVYLTNGIMQGNNINIKEEKDISNLIKAYSSVQAREEAYNKAAVDLERDSYPVFKDGGFTTDEWMKDIKLRIAIIEQQETLNNLNTIKKEYEELMDKEDRMALLHEKIKNL